jgi:3'-phosphoadenosine 5'-phosphosulfate sulfotransferase (PAPS reductase)/FAD synthetase
MRHIQPISGKDSLATAILQKRREPDLPYEYLYNPTGMDLPEVDTWLSLVEDYLGVKIERVGDDLEAIMYEQKILPAHKTRYCTRLAKIIPMEEWIGTEQATVYYGIRADEHRAGYQSLSGGNITPVYPLKEEGYTLPMVWELVSQLDLLPPRFFWQSMYDMVVKRLGVASELLTGYKPWEMNVLFAWRTRPNCYHCFYQSLWELAGLLEHHPDLFWHTADIETEIGTADKREKAFTLKRNWPLAKIAEKKDIIKRKRCIAICKTIIKRAKVEMVFDDEPELDEELDMLDVVPCGLFCGK